MQNVTVCIFAIFATWLLPSCFCVLLGASDVLWLSHFAKCFFVYCILLILLQVFVGQLVEKYFMSGHFSIETPVFIIALT